MCFDGCSQDQVEVFELICERVLWECPCSVHRPTVGRSSYSAFLFLFSDSGIFFLELRAGHDLGDWCLMLFVPDLHSFA